jgi:Na+-driven multidrug efflux pump
MLNETALQQHGLTIMPMAFLQTFIAYNGDAASVLNSKQLGAQHKETIKKYVNTAHAFGVSCGILGIAGIGGIAETYIRYYTDSSIATPEFISTTRNLLFLSSLNQTISSVGVTSVGSLRGIDENWRPLIINLGLKLGLNLLASFLLMYGTDLGVYSPYVSDLIVSSVFYAPLLFYYCKTKVASFTYQVANEDIELVSSVTSQNTSSSQLDLTETSLSEVEKDHQSFSTVKSFLGWIYPSSRASNPVAPNDEVTENRTSLRRRWFLV